MMELANVLVFGASSFIGSAACKQLAKNGHNVIAAYRSTTRPERIQSFGSNKMLVAFDEHKLETVQLQKQLAFDDIDVLIDFSWEGVGGTNRNSMLQVKNIGRLLANLRLGRDLGAKAYVGFGSQAEYGPCEGIIDESQETHPTTMYGAAKLAAFHATRIQAELLGMNHTWVRVFSTYGPDDSPDWLIPSLVRSLSEGFSPRLTKGEQLWDYLHVEDAAKAIAAIASTPGASGLFNLGSGEANSIRDLVSWIGELVDPSIHLGFGTEPYRPDQVMHLQANIDKIKHVTGWQPTIDIRDGLSNTVSSILGQSDSLDETQS